MISISNVVNVSLSSVAQSLADFNTGNLMVITDETPLIANPSDVMIYADSSSVASDFGSGSNVYNAANIIFSQSPNILSAGGRMLVGRVGTISATHGTETLAGTINYTTLKAIDDGCIKISVDGGSAVELTDLDFSDVEDIVDVYNIFNAQTITGASVSLNQGMLVFTSSTTGTTSSITLSAGTTGTDISTALDIANAVIMNGTAQRSETPTEAFLRLFGAVYFGGLIYLPTISDSDFMALANSVQSKNCMMFKGLTTSTQITTGIGYQVKALGLSHTRCIYPSQDVATAYASSLLATNFKGSNTAKTMHLKTLSGVSADDSITDTVLASLEFSGVDSYLYVAGLPKVWTTKANTYSDEILNQIWLVNAMQVAGFNCLAQTNTKIPQTEYGMSLLKSAYETVCQQAVANGSVGAGTWSIQQTFGDPEVFKSSISSYGYYIYSASISSQSASERESRVAPLIQIAVKFTGAIHSTDVIILVNR